MIKALFLDFYGTVVHEDGAVIREITQKIFETGRATDQKEIASFWWNEFQTMFSNSYGETFETQRALEIRSLRKTVERFLSSADPEEMSRLLFEHWRRPPIFTESKRFFEKCPVPIHIVSNIDTGDIMKALKFHDLKPAQVFTSEDAKSYKPRKELFELALRSTGLRPEEVLHIGDSLTGDVQGAASSGIRAIWLNRSRREVPEGIIAVGDLMEVFEMEDLGFGEE